MLHTVVPLKVCQPCDWEGHSGFFFGANGLKTDFACQRRGGEQPFSAAAAE